MLTAQADHLRRATEKGRQVGTTLSPRRPAFAASLVKPLAAIVLLAGAAGAAVLLPGKSETPVVDQVPAQRTKPGRRSRSKLHICLCLRPVGRATMRQKRRQPRSPLQAKPKRRPTPPWRRSPRNGRQQSHEHHYRKILRPRALRSRSSRQACPRGAPVSATGARFARDLSLLKPEREIRITSVRRKTSTLAPPPSRAAGTASRIARRARGRLRCASTPASSSAASFWPP